ncbi:excinuclease ABC subunit UvrB [Porphyromonas endodontalis]|uniref:UvrABC system protein B n=1 Tax=Porphyromonas endodontalis (strain ATCC 35406 / DSM 24491 / JCM 8526 / CCUG 16442 / BCRC 14492 / NCTC 13058 / HG 370) TaxID=553175 RepID=C3JAC0_POREA|nr:excinuclease ABC subunit UvrB [Porphyromonas endodontalis]EEN82868.1 excinuclease ABC, B subunit [Porphyromonas endodontalis ATCC 35406]UBH64069.1 excinuclease ABC subunit UvrB [Porphyromonas endodontalis]SUB67664.1 Excinuclease ABC subunit B [Porphyromonas endodontalis]
MNFELTSQYKPTGDQPEAISQLVAGLKQNIPAQTLLGVTGSGKTFTIANVIAQANRPTLIVSHNKTLAAQLYSEFKAFFPHNAVEYFVSYYDYYQPEAYLATTDTYIEKDMAINAEIEKMRLRTTASLLSGRRDVIVVSSVSCLYGMADPHVFSDCIITLKRGMTYPRSRLMRDLAASYYINNKVDFTSGSFRVNGDTIDIFPAIEGYDGVAYRVEYWDDEIDSLSVIHPVSGTIQGELDNLSIYPANLFVTTKEQTKQAIEEIKKDLALRVAELESMEKHYEATRLQERVKYDVEMISEIGYCTGIENYSRYFDGRSAGARPFCLLDYFPQDFLLVVDESHVTIPQVRAMYGGDKARKTSLVDYGFRLPAALDNRPLTFDEFRELTPSTIYISATPAEYELEESEGVIIEQIIRPTGLPDPIIEVRPTEHQVDDLMEEIQQRRERHQRVLVTTLTKRMAEELSEYLQRAGIATAYIHSDVDTLERIRILDELRKGVFDVLVGVNLLREGLDLPEVSLVAILDADKEGFLRSHRSLTQTAGRAARHVEGKVLFYADKVTESMQQTIDETADRRERQLAYNKANNITPRQVVKSGISLVSGGDLPSTLPAQAYIESSIPTKDPMVEYLSASQLRSLLDSTRKKMYEAAKALDFSEAARLRDEANDLETKLLKLERAS